MPFQQAVWPNPESVGGDHLRLRLARDQGNINVTGQLGGPPEDFKRPDEIEFVGSIEDKNSDIHAAFQQL